MHNLIKSFPNDLYLLQHRCGRYQIVSGCMLDIFGLKIIFIDSEAKFFHNENLDFLRTNISFYFIFRPNNFSLIA